MADLSDVESALVSGVTTALYPTGAAQPSVVEAICRIYRGWPAPSSLNTDLSAGIVNVTIHPVEGADEMLVPYLDPPNFQLAPTGLTATVTGQTVTLSGQASSNQTIGLLIDGKPFTYGVALGDSVQSVASNLSAIVAVDRASLVAGPTLSIPGAVSLIARVMTNAMAIRGIRRQRHLIRVSCWCPSAALRDAVSATVDLALSSSSFIDLSDGTSAHLRYASTQVFDRRRMRCFSDATCVISVNIQ